MMALLNWRVWAVVAIAVMLAASHWKAYKLGESGVRAEWAEAKLAEAEQTTALLFKANVTTAALQASADKLRKTKNAQIAKLSADLATALDGLRERPSRPGPGDLPGPAGAGPAGCTGAGLFRPDAEFLTRKAAQRDHIAVLLEQCQAQYGKARDALK